MTERIKFAVVKWRDMNGHEDLEHGGYVVRSAYEQADGSWWVPRPYDDVVPTILYAREKAAEKRADKLNGHKVGEWVKVDVDYQVIFYGPGSPQEGEIKGLCCLHCPEPRGLTFDTMNFRRGLARYGRMRVAMQTHVRNCHAEQFGPCGAAGNVPRGIA